MRERNTTYWSAGWRPYSRQEELLWVGSVGESPLLWVMSLVLNYQHVFPRWVARLRECSWPIYMRNISVLGLLSADHATEWLYCAHSKSIYTLEKDLILQIGNDHNRLRDWWSLIRNSLKLAWQNQLSNVSLRSLPDFQQSSRVPCMTAYFPTRLGKIIEELRSLKLGIQKTHLLFSSGDAHSEAGHRWQLFKNCRCKAVISRKCPLLFWHSLSIQKQSREMVKQRLLNSTRIQLEVLCLYPWAEAHLHVSEMQLQWLHTSPAASRLAECQPHYN